MQNLKKNLCTRIKHITFWEHVNQFEHLKAVSTLKKKQTENKKCMYLGLYRKGIHFITHSSSNQSHCTLVPGESLHCQQKTVLLSFLSAKTQHSDLNMRKRGH